MILRDSLGRECRPLPTIYREVQVLRPRKTRRVGWLIIEAFAVVGFMALALVAFALVSR